MKIALIVAYANHRVIGKDNTLLWHLPVDMKRFKNLTTGHYILMGRKTYESIGRPLPNRTSIVITRQKDYHIGVSESCIVANSIPEGILAIPKTEETVFIIGGAEIYQQSLALADIIYATEIEADYDGDAFFPALSEEWKAAETEYIPANDKNIHPCLFVTYKKYAT